MEIKRLVVCGDSFCSADTGFPGTHFSEILADNYGYEVTNLARGGITNTAICFQIKQAVELGADLIIFADTDVSRVDIPLKPFNKHLGLRNFIYPYKSDLSTNSKYVGTVDANIYSDTIPSMMEGRPDLPAQLKIDSELKTALKYYISHLHDHNLQSQINEWILGYWEFVLSSKNINYIWINRSKIWEPIKEFVACNPTETGKRCYHTDSATQQIVATSLKKYIDKL